MDLTNKTPSIVAQESLAFGFYTSPVTNNFSKHDEEKYSNNIIVQRENVENRSSTSSFSSFSSFSFSSCATLSNKETVKKIDVQNQNEQKNNVTASEKSTFSKSRNNYNGKFTIFRNCICGAVDTNDSSIVSKNQTNSSSFRASSKEKTEFGSNKSFTPAYKPKLRYPKCSQCGKPFKPEKFHSHMKSCKGMKALTRGSTSPIITSATAVEKTSKEPSEVVDSVSGYYLTN